MAGPNLARIHGVVAEIFAAQRPVFIADQPVLRYDGRVEFQLNLDILGNGLEGRGPFGSEDLLRYWLLRVADRQNCRCSQISDNLFQQLGLPAGARPHVLGLFGALRAILALCLRGHQRKVFQRFRMDSADFFEIPVR